MSEYFINDNIVSNIIKAEHDRQKKLVEEFNVLWDSEEWTLEQQRKLNEFKRKVLYK